MNPIYEYNKKFIVVIFTLYFYNYIPKGVIRGHERLNTVVIANIRSIHAY